MAENTDFDFRSHTPPMSANDYQNWQEKIKGGTLRDTIMSVTTASEYDHRPYLNHAVAVQFPHILQEDNLQYARFKFAVAAILQPRTIYEVGVGYGISGKAFLAGCPSTKYFGIDNACMGIDPNDALGHNPDLLCQVTDSLTIPSFVHPHGEIDLLHVDANHTLPNTISDVTKALEARPEWLLVDDVHNVTVAAGTFITMYRMHHPELHMMYFENSHTGSLLVHVQRRAPADRLLTVEGGLD